MYAGFNTIYANSQWSSNFIHMAMTAGKIPVKPTGRECVWWNTGLSRGSLNPERAYGVNVNQEEHEEEGSRGWTGTSLV